MTDSGKGRQLGTANEAADPASDTEPTTAQVQPVVDIFPIAIGHYADPGIQDLDVEPQVGRLVDMLAPFGGRHRAWAHPLGERGADAVQHRLHEWPLPLTVAARRDPLTDSAFNPTAGSSVLYWVGHGWSDGTRAALAHSESPATIGGSGIEPQQLAYAIRRRQASIMADLEGSQDGGWTLVVVDACRSTQIVDAVTKTLLDQGVSGRLLLVSVSADGATSLGRFTGVLRNLLADTYRGERKVLLRDLAEQLERVLGAQNIYQRGLGESALVRIHPPAASWMSAPMDTIQHLEEVLDSLSLDERSHFFVKAQGAEHGELSWFFEGRHEEIVQINSWLRQATSGMPGIRQSRGSCLAR
jgi:hypothetical protein